MDSNICSDCGVTNQPVMYTIEVRNEDDDGNIIIGYRCKSCDDKNDEKEAKDLEREYKDARAKPKTLDDVLFFLKKYNEI